MGFSSLTRLCVFRSGAEQSGESLPSLVRADQLRVVQRPETSRLVLPDDRRRVRPAALTAQHVQRGRGPLVRLFRRP